MIDGHVEREVVGAGKIWDVTITGLYSTMDGHWVKPMGLFVQAPGAFIVIGLLFAFFNIVKNRKKCPKPAAPAEEPVAKPAEAAAPAEADKAEGDS